MRLVLKDFQLEVVEDLVGKLRRAAKEVYQSKELQAVGLSSPTGSGKTVMATAAMECLLEGDDENKALPDAVFLWITDQPQLNEQTRRKMLKDSSVFTEVNLVTIGPAFDQEVFTAGTVNFLNIQKLGRERELITNGDGRRNTIWETISNTVEAIPDRFIVIIDEAHRGMSEGSQGRKEASSIIQKFIKGSPGEIPSVPLILGISATLERYNNLVSGTGRTMRSTDVPVEQVRASGLLKEVVTLYHPTETQPSDITMLREAVRSWRKFHKEWELYNEAQNEDLIRPILVVQVEDAAARRVSRTDLDEVVNAIEDELGGLPPSALAHAFQEGGTLEMNGHEVRYLAPSDIDSDREVQVVFFKTSLNTGWDCPRAEVMMSFRTARDATSIAQLVGRMVRSPLARRIESIDFLNGVSLYLPHYDEDGLNRVIDRLTAPDPETLPPVEFRRGDNQVTVVQDPKLGEVAKVIERLPSYIIPTRRRTSQVKRLMKLARALSNDEIDPDADESGLNHLLATLRAEYARVSDSDNFTNLVDEQSDIVVRAVDWQVGLEDVGEDSTITIEVSRENIDDLFEEAGRRIGDEGLHKEWWKSRRHDGTDNKRAKLELTALSIDPAVRKKLEAEAQQLVQQWLRNHSSQINALAERRRQIYDEVKRHAAEPELRTCALPSEMTVTKSDAVWEGHLYIDGGGNYPAALNNWELAVVNEELQQDPDAVWFRNLPRKPWAITIPYEVNGKAAPFYPDFVFVRKRDGEWAADLLDPHHIDMADAPAKAVGLARYAAKHNSEFNRIELIIVRGDGEIMRIDLTDEQKRDRVLAVTSKEHLGLLFDLA